jgi:uncharacterized membrane protein
MATGPPRLYHHWMSSEAPALRRLAVGGAIWVVFGLVVSPFVTWPMAILVGWDCSAAAFLVTVLPVVTRSDGPRTKTIATREDETRDMARLLVQLSCGASLVAVAFALGLAKDQSGARRALVVAISLLSVVLSWIVVNTVFTLRYADLYYQSPTTAVDFGGATATDVPDYRDFAYLAFTIGMTYQVSDTALLSRVLRRTALYHAFVSYFFGVVIIATGVNVVAGLVG